MLRTLSKLNNNSPNHAQSFVRSSTDYRLVHKITISGDYINPTEFSPQPHIMFPLTSRFPKWSLCLKRPHNTGRFIMFSVITNIYNKKTKGPALMELFTATVKLKKFFI